MGFNEAYISLDSPHGTFYSGQIVSGNLIFKQYRVKTFQGEHKIEPGYHKYPFSFQLPPDCPPSFEGPHGHIRYKIKAVVQRIFKFDQEKKIEFRVVAPLDLNFVPNAKNPINIAFYTSYDCCCFNSGSTKTFVEAPISGYCPGQKFPIQITCINNDSIEINNIVLRIKKKTTYIASRVAAKKSKKEIIAVMNAGPVPERTTRNWNVQMIVPALEIYNLTNCKYIDIEYNLEAILHPGGCNGNSKQSCKLIFGSIPLRGYENNLRQPPQVEPQISAITEQPMFSPLSVKHPP